MNFKKLDSTSSFLKRNYRKLKSGTIVSASFQTSGHGRMGRAWDSKPGENLMFSILIKDEELIEMFDSISLSSAVAIRKSIENLGIENTFIKWPNDVYIGNKKTCGILLESESEDGKIKCLVIGIGVNVNQSEFPVDTATSISNELGKKISLNSFKKIVFGSIRSEYELLKRKDLSYLEDIRKHDYLSGKCVDAEVGGERKSVNVLGVNDDNSLKVEFDGQIKNLKTGEITFHKNK